VHDREKMTGDHHLDRMKPSPSGERGAGLREE
jgi:hypothetical protein